MEEDSYYEYEYEYSSLSNLHHFISLRKNVSSLDSVYGCSCYSVYFFGTLEMFVTFSKK